ncbi:MAG TPA: DUF5985 family protein [Ramlibacter sp.]|uniref:DUF5985 family protein n=1 Tax=Ramlibacter sp. TaxID=1917967 RepID=UPI002B5AFC93|nr:DUF5985 family protein [Ramlibacter sp.]HVZ43139.1 DUF5985 family protein [Ramlibacter sp.]
MTAEFLTGLADNLAGAIAFGWVVVGLFFFKFWHHTRDRFFLWFALSFWMEAVNRIFITISSGDESDPLFYGIRVISYGLILLAIWQKNQPLRRRDRDRP